MALREVKEGEELCISYGEAGRLGFVDADEGRGDEDGGGELDAVEGLERLVLGLDEEQAEAS